MSAKTTREASFECVHPRLPVTDLDRTIDFYTAVLGFDLHVLWPDDDPVFCMLGRGGVGLAFDVADAPRHDTADLSGFYLRVDDALAVHDRVRDRVAVEWGPEVYDYGCREFAFRDPDGYLVIISERTDDPPTCLDS